MRIIAGRFKGRKIKAPKGLATRPVLAGVREALFNILGGVEGTRFLDLFAGTGAVGMEALSRGARSAVFVERGAEQCRVIHENLEAIGVDAEVIRSEVGRALRRFVEEGREFDIVFADPPYGLGLSQQTIESVCGSGVLAGSGLLAATVRKSEEVPPEAGDCRKILDRRYGDTRLVIYKRMD